MPAPDQLVRDPDPVIGVQVHALVVLRRQQEAQLRARSGHRRGAGEAGRSGGVLYSREYTKKSLFSLFQCNTVTLCSQKPEIAI